MIARVTTLGALVLVGLLGHSGPSLAGDLRVAAQNMRLAAELCLRNYRTPADTKPAFAAAGYQLSPGLDAGVTNFNAPGVSGGFEAGYCFIQSTDVPLAMAEEMGLRLAQSLFPGKVELGNPELPVGQPVPPCDGLSVFATQNLIRISYSAAGNGGDCINDGSSAIVINM
ncbi:MAG: hypothetical protein AAGI36_03865 [Pseudomonadota bacterium]